MFKQFKLWAKKIEFTLDAVSSKLDVLLTNTENPITIDSIEVIRHTLGSIDFSDVKEDEELSEAERKAYCASISGIYPRLEKDIKRFLYAQVLYTANQAEVWERVIFGRGTFNGMDVLLEHWKKAHEEHLANARPEDPFDPNAPIGEINT